MTPGEKTPAVVLGGGINGLGVVRSLGSAGVPVFVLDPDSRAPAMRSRYGRARIVPAIGQENSIMDVLANLPRAVRQRRPVLILTTEDAVMDAMRHYPSLDRAYRLTTAEPEFLQPALHKASMRDLAADAGLRIPQTVHITHEDQLSGLGSLPLPWVVKPAERNAAYAQQFDKAYRVDHLEQGRQLVEQMLSINPDIIVQEWIEGRDSDLYFCLQYRPRAGGQAVSFVGRKLRSWPPQVGGTASCTIAGDATCLVDGTDAFFQHAGIWGLVSMEYKRHPDTGEYVVVEPTVGRTDFQEEVATLHGINLPLAAYYDALDMPLSSSHSSGPPVIWTERMGASRSAEATGEASAARIPGAKTMDALHRWRDPWPAGAALIDRIGRRVLALRQRLAGART